MTALAISSVYSLVYMKQWRIRWRIIGAAAALSLLANWIRVFGLAVIAHQTQMQSPLIGDHEAYGWWIFAATMALFFALLPRLERGDSPAPVAPTPTTSATDAPTAVTILTATAAALVGPLLLLLVSALPVSGEPSASIPGIRPGVVWTPADAAPAGEVWAPGFRGATEHRTLFVRRDSVTVRVDRFVYRQQAQGAEMVGGENAVAPDSLLLEERVVGPLDADARSVRQAAVRDGEQLRMVWYWYRVFDVETPSRAKAKLLEIPAFFNRHGLSEVITLSIPCNGRDCGNAATSLYHLATGRELPAASAP
jgi:exosortase/archaeosortase family protein